jgi:hypothetical protein
MLNASRERRMRYCCRQRFHLAPRISQLLCDIYLGFSQLYDARLADDQDEQHDDDPAEEQIVSRHLQQLPF